MADNVSQAERSRIMRLVRSKDTSAEMKVRRALHAAGFRFRVHDKALAGKPDIVLPRYKAVVLVQGCLWHWHGCKRSRMPASRAAYWSRKIDRNVQRDASNRETLRQAGWSIHVVWECELRQSVTALIQRLAAKKLTVQEPHDSLKCSETSVALSIPSNPVSPSGN
jgi:DNA mismatch endonuclease (patch repair protein)